MMSNALLNSHPATSLISPDVSLVNAQSASPTIISIPGSSKILPLGCGVERYTVPNREAKHAEEFMSEYCYLALRVQKL
jgi:hypothetical protein